MNEQEAIAVLQTGKKFACDLHNMYYKLINNVVEVYYKHEVKPYARYSLNDFIIFYWKYLTNVRIKP